MVGIDLLKYVLFIFFIGILKSYTISTQSKVIHFVRETVAFCHQTTGKSSIKSWEMKRETPGNITPIDVHRCSIVLEYLPFLMDHDTVGTDHLFKGLWFRISPWYQTSTSSHLGHIGQEIPCTRLRKLLQGPLSIMQMHVVQPWQQPEKWWWLTSQRTWIGHPKRKTT